MDITTLNDRHLYRGTVTVQDDAHPSGQLELEHRIVRFGPTGWLTVTTGGGDADRIEMYPLHRVLLVDDLEEATPDPALLGG
ncbi:MAG: hypothetical protein JWQ26_1931 [Modestobacter sp.]|jgi:hypothetical protein|nr:hypothetical protein [Modestobacter sp.]